MRTRLLEGELFREGAKQRDIRHSNGVVYAVLFFALSYFLFLSPVNADTELKFDHSTIHSGKGLQKAYAAVMRDKLFYTVGVDETSVPTGHVAVLMIPPVESPVWTFDWPGGRSDPSSRARFYGLDIDRVGNLYIVGLEWMHSDTEDKAAATNGLLAKFKSRQADTGTYADPIWVARSEFFPLEKIEAFYDVTVSEESGFSYLYVVGRASARFQNSLPLLAKYDTSGNLMWVRFLAGTERYARGAATSVAIADDAVYVGGYAGLGDPEDNYDLIPVRATIWKYDFAGTKHWSRDLASPLPPRQDLGRDLIVRVRTDSDFVYAVTGQRTGMNQLGRVVVSKYSSNGELDWNAKPSLASENGEPWQGFPMDLAIGDERIYVAGQSVFEDGNTDTFLLEMDKIYGSKLAEHKQNTVGQSEMAVAVGQTKKGLQIIGSVKTTSDGDGWKKGKGDEKSEKSSLLSEWFLKNKIRDISIDIVPNESSNMVVLKKEVQAKDEEERLVNKDRKVTVAILSTAQLDAPNEIDWRTLTFGRTGYEQSLSGCQKKDVDNDHRLDLLCDFFVSWKSARGNLFIFELPDSKGVLRGQLLNGDRVFGNDRVHVLQEEILSAASEPVFLGESVSGESVSDGATGEEGLTALTSDSNSEEAADVFNVNQTTSASESEDVEQASVNSNETTSEMNTSTTTESPSDQTADGETVTHITSTQTTSSQHLIAYIPVTNTVEPTSEPSTTSSETAALTTAKTSDGAKTVPSIYDQPNYEALYESLTSREVEHLGYESLASGSGERNDLGEQAAEDEYAEGLEQAYFDYGEELARNGKYRDAIASFREALKESPGFIEAREGLARALVQNGDYSEAVKEYREVMKTKQDSAHLHHELALALIQLDQSEEAVAELRRALELDPSLVESKSVLERLLNQTSDASGTQEPVQNPATIDPSSVSVS